jgi:hypothetical protein
MSISRRTLFGAAAAGACVAGLEVPAVAQDGSAPIDIGGRLELLLDDYLIDGLSGASLALHRPVARELALDHDRPWEGNTCTYHTVFHDGERYRMYYRGSHWDETAKRSGHPEVACYAESSDGIHWHRPELGLYEFEGSKRNNIVWRGEVANHNFAPFRDRNPACADAARYKAVGSGKGGLFAFQSPDGIHWSLMQPEPVITDGAFDSLNVAMWDQHRKCYVDFHRKPRGGKRAIVTCKSTDFLHWSPAEYLEYPGAPEEHLYTNAIAPYARAPHLYLGFPKRFMPDRNPIGHVDPGVSDGVFMTSRDGRRFKRWTEAFIRPGLQPSRWINRNNLTAWGIVETASDLPDAPGELSIYSTEHYYTGKSAKLRRHSLRMDGFVSVQAPLAGGELRTKPLRFKGERLILNLSTSGAGSVQVEVQDAEGKPLPGFALADTPELVGDYLAHAVPFKQNLAALQERPVRLRFLLKDADLFSLQFRG